jgi:hypothetical protein
MASVGRVVAWPPWGSEADEASFSGFVGPEQIILLKAMVAGRESRKSSAFCPDAR